jgi:hypothetical protein
MLEKTDKNGIYKNVKTGAIVNKDINKLNAYKKQKAIMQSSKIATQNVDELKNELSEMKSEMSEMKMILNEIKTLIRMEEK